ncbi:response regulator transcription factor [Paenibacillus sacheonensis]|uniref:Response regulator n=1 Tax=Paenibacillus sacheonensis TaxID=742054 RepID=A0A7X4YSI5_9BACL|nr:response regulator transcription factor [Paenibacillus sacheonensis]MBM7569239.1 DNA-binding NarL/FixJ family response regulator [Paenibacillus sacheonensis]NBC71750.1 response regulator [Paenibacillus sacheonensis]
MKIKVLIADDNSFIREGMRIILNTFGEFEVLDAVEDGQQAVEYCRTHDVDVALLDVRMPNMNGVEATRLITEQTSTKPLILTTFDDDEYILEAIRCGAKGYLLKNNDPERIRDAIKSVYHGNNVLQDIILDKLKGSIGAQPANEASTAPKPTARDASGASGAVPAPTSPIDLSPFTERETEVMALIAKGYSNKEISKELFISEGTTANYITSILNKTALEHRTQIAIYYLTGRTR